MGRDKKKTATPRVPPPADEFGYGVYVKTRAYARHDSAQDFCRLLCTAMSWIFIPAYSFALP